MLWVLESVFSETWIVRHESSHVIVLNCCYTIANICGSKCFIKALMLLCFRQSPGCVCWRRWWYNPAWECCRTDSLHWFTDWNWYTDCVMSILESETNCCVGRSVIFINNMKHLSLCLFIENPYTYEWSFVSAPVGHPGVMEGKHKRTVKVSEVRLLILGKDFDTRCLFLHLNTLNTLNTLNVAFTVIPGIQFYCCTSNFLHVVALCRCVCYQSQCDREAGLWGKCSKLHSASW